MISQAERLIRAVMLFAFAAPLVIAQVSVLTWHNDAARTGQNLLETTLTPANVNAATFGKLFVVNVDGKVDAQPLYVPALTIPGFGLHNVLYVVTEHDSVYAVDADNGALLKQVSLLGTNETPSDDRGCGQVTPEIGITSTPVIDLQKGAHGTIYAVAMSKDSSGNYHQRLHALDLTTLAEEFSGPVEITATFPGSGDESNGTVVTFSPKQHKERAALLLSNGIIYTSWSSHCDSRPYTGWVMGYDATNLHQVSVLNLTPHGSDAGIWAAGAGPAVDTNGNVYLLTGNGTFDTTLTAGGFPVNGDYGNAFVKMSTGGGTLAVADYFTMSNTTSESNADADLGSGGLILLPPLNNSQGQAVTLAVGAGKDQKVYIVNSSNMGKFNPSLNNDFQTLLLGGGVYSSPAWFNGKLYYGAVSDALKAFSYSNGAFSTNPVTQSSQTYPYPGATPSISANGTSNAILWAAENSSVAALHAYDANNLSNELYNSNQAANSRDHFGTGNKFIVPTVVNGKVYVGTTNGVGVFGLLGPAADFSITVSPATQTIAPGGGTTYNVTVTGTGGFVGTVNFSIAGLPTGVTATFSPSTVGGSGSTVLTISSSSSAANANATLTVTASNGTLSHTASTQLIVAASTAPSSASFVKMDNGTQGNWRGVYGGDGYTIVGDTASNPAYVTPSPSGQNLAVWASSASDGRALQKGSNPSDRIAATWYTGGSFTVDLPITDSNTHQLALYLLDWDTTSRRQVVDILDGNGNVLNSQNLAASFNGGTYLVWNVAGHVKVRVTLTGGANAVLSGLFFGAPGNPVNPAPGSATFLQMDTSTHGNWHGVYGGDGFTVVGDSSSNPAYVTPSPAGQSLAVWASSASDGRALQKGSNPSDRIAATWYSSGSFIVDLPITDSNTHQMALYCLDWDTTARRETVDILDANGNVLSSQSLTGSFNGGVYLVWNVSGHVKVRVTLTGGANPVLSGLFFGGVGNTGNPGVATFVKLDTTTKGNWHGVYGLDGYNVLSDQSSNPSYVTPSPAGQNPFTWASSVTDVRALQKASNLSDRVAGGWYTYGAFTVDLPFTDANTHQLAVYCLDFDTTARRETVDILDASGNVLNSQSLASSFSGGAYLVWNVSGHVKLRVTLTGGANAVISGFFFAAP